MVSYYTKHIKFMKPNITWSLKKKKKEKREEKAEKGKEYTAQTETKRTTSYSPKIVK